MMPCVTSALVDEPRRPRARQTLSDTLAASIAGRSTSNTDHLRTSPCQKRRGGGGSGVARSRRRGREMIVFHTDGVRDAFVAASFFVMTSREAESDLLKVRCGKLNVRIEATVSRWLF